MLLLSAPDDIVGPAAHGRSGRIVSEGDRCRGWRAVTTTRPPEDQFRFVRRIWACRTGRIQNFLNGVLCHFANRLPNNAQLRVCVFGFFGPIKSKQRHIFGYSKPKFIQSPHSADRLHVRADENGMRPVRAREESQSCLVTPAPRELVPSDRAIVQSCVACGLQPAAFSRFDIAAGKITDYESDSLISVSNEMRNGLVSSSIGIDTDRRKTGNLAIRIEEDRRYSGERQRRNRSRENRSEKKAVDLPSNEVGHVTTLLRRVAFAVGHENCKPSCCRNIFDSPRQFGEQRVFDLWND